MRKINKLKLFYNGNEKSFKVVEQLTKKIKSNNYIICDDFDLGIAIGGDGAFLRMIRNSNFNNNCYYVGINTGTLGFAQEINPLELDHFLNAIEKNLFEIKDIAVGKAIVKKGINNDIHCFINEVTIRELNMKTAKLNLLVDDYLLEEFSGDGILISTTFGSTAYNLSFGGSIVYPNLDILQITPIAPLNNKSYRNLLNSVILPNTSRIEIKPITNDILLNIDGENIVYTDVESILTSKKEEGIKVLKIHKTNFTSKINEKFLKS